MGLHSRTVAVSTFLAALVLATANVSAHEEYVVDEERDVSLGEFYADVLTDPFVVGPLLAGALLVCAVVVGYLRYRPFSRDVGAFRAAMAGYTENVPGSSGSHSAFR